MATERQIAANRRNARNSTGPRSSAAKRRTSQNAYRHGLAASHNPGPATAKQLDQLAREIAGDCNSVIVLELARSAAQAEFDLARVRLSKVALIKQISAFGVIPQTSDAILDKLREDRARHELQEHRARIKHLRAGIRDFKAQLQLVKAGLLHITEIKELPPMPDPMPDPIDPVDPAKTMPAQEPERTAEAVRRALPELLKLSRYETRAVSRRDRAIREITKIRSSRDRLT
jgi:hypothetical protein